MRSDSGFYLFRPSELFCRKEERKSGSSDKKFANHSPTNESTMMNNGCIQLFDAHRARVLAIVLIATGGLLLAIPHLGFCVPWKENPELQRVYDQMEAIGKKLSSFHARVTQKKYTALLKEFETPEAGEFYLKRAKDGSTMIRQEITSPGRTILTVKGGIATAFQPGIKQARVLNLGKHKDKAEFLALGIANRPGDLQKTFYISYQGQESVNGVLCSVLILKPRDPKTAAYYSTIVLWIKQSSGIPIQQKLQEPNNDYLLVTFSEETLNPQISDSKFEQKLPQGVEIQTF
jgi:outer membrane lipoprotein-sorting protein